MSTDETNPTSGRSGGSDVRAARRAQREAERAARAQRKADAARERAMEAARAGGLFEGMEAMPRTDTDTDATTDDTQRAAAGQPAAGPASGERSGAATTAPGRPTAAATTGDRPTVERPRAGARPTTGDRPFPPESEPMDPALRRRLIAILAVASVILLALAGLATWQYLEARDASSVEQQVTSAKTEATESAREIATQMFTYDHRTVDADLGAVRERLTDPALTEFVEQSMPTVAASAKQQEASVYATVAAAAPEEVVDADHVTVLVMLNRMVSTKESPEAASSASRLRLQMERVDGTWKLAKVEAL